MVGVGRTPTSTISQPAASKPQWTACCSISPVVRVSRPTMTSPLPTYVPNACPNCMASPGVRKSPTTPRIPETPILRRCSRGMLCETPDFFEERFEEFFGRVALLLADDPHDRLGLADTDVKPAAGPVHAQAVEHADAAVAVALAQVRQQRRDALRHQGHLAL